MKRTRRTLLSVTDKSSLADIAEALASHGVEMVSTGGTARLLCGAGLEVRDVSELTGFPEMLDGRLKTLHPKIHGGVPGMSKRSASTALGLAVWRRLLA